jgi:biopolymer transport protein ExbB
MICIDTLPRLRTACFGLLLCLPLAGHAWWNADWSQRTKIVLNTSVQGVTTTEAVNTLPLAVRLHSGNFDFLAAREDGADLRFVAGDDKTLLVHRIEQFDPINELAVVWVQVPSIAPGSDKNTLHAYAGNAQAVTESAGTVFDAATLLAVHFDDSPSQGTSHDGTIKATGAVVPQANALLGGGAVLAGAPIVWPASEKLRIAASRQATVSMWLRAEAPARGTLFAWGPVSLDVADARLGLSVAGSALAGAELAPGAWTHVAMTLGNGKATLYLNGVRAAQADAATPAIAGELRVGEGLRGTLDELQVANVVRSADWLLLTASSQSAEARLIAATRESNEADAGSPNYIGVLVKNLTVDAWVVIIILGVMFVVAAWVMLIKAIFVDRADKANRGFLRRFRGATHDLLTLGEGATHPNSSLFRLYQAGVHELKKRHVGTEGAKPLSGASLDAVKAAVDANLVRESHGLNAHMVLLTIAISGGPFLGLLGTVVGVMITFAAIAAAGDVNVNAIAPGIAAALLATVAGLAVAIPALFGYNYLASRIKNISSDMQIFVDEFITRVAEDYGAP